MPRLRLPIALPPLLWLLLACGVPAAQAADSDKDKENLYELELVVFALTAPEEAGEEMWRPVTLGAEAGVAAPTRPVEDGEAWLGPLAEKLRQTGRYRVLAHQHWIQAAEPKGQAKPVPVSPLPGQAAALQGNIRFYVSRHPHVDVQLLFRPQAENPDGPSFLLNEQRRVKHQEIHYFDHPRLGAVLRVVSRDKLAGKPGG